MVSPRPLWLRLVCAAVLLFPATAMRAAEVKASLDRDTVAAGEGAKLTIAITDGDAEDPQPPHVPDFIFQGGGRSVSMSFFNGQTSKTTTYTYIIGSNKPGDYTIPAFAVMVDGKEFKTQELKLKVTAAGTPPQGNPAAAPAEPGEANAGGFLTVETVTRDRKHGWVGEIMPVRIRAWLPAGAQPLNVSGLQSENPAFTLHNVSPKAQQSGEQRGGKNYLVLTWFGGLSAAKPGDHLPELSLKAVVAVRDPNGRRRRPRSPFGGPDPFDDPFFDSVFQQTIQKEVTLTPPPGENFKIEVRELPAQDKPENFAGAVGSFAFGGASLPAKWLTGEPQQITASITGAGNFNLLAQPDIVPAEQWKTYDGKSEFAPKDQASFSGTQTFRFNAVPRKGGAQEVHLALSYFDPDTGKYATITSPVQNITVTGTDVAAPVPAAAAPAPPKQEEPQSDLAPLPRGDTMTRSLTPFAYLPAFRLTLYCAGGAALAAVVLGRLLAARRDPQRRARGALAKTARAALDEAESFAARGDVKGFLAAARRALQVRLAAQWELPAQAITLADVARRIPGSSPVLEIFREADRVEYSPASALAGADVVAWRTRLHEALQSLPAPA